MSSREGVPRPPLREGEPLRFDPSECVLLGSSAEGDPGYFAGWYVAAG